MDIHSLSLSKNTTMNTLTMSRVHEGCTFGKTVRLKWSQPTQHSANQFLQSDDNLTDNYVYC